MARNRNPVFKKARQLQPGLTSGDLNFRTDCGPQDLGKSERKECKVCRPQTQYEQSDQEAENAAHNRAQDDTKPHWHPRHFYCAVPFFHRLRQTILGQGRGRDTNRVFNN